VLAGAHAGFAGERRTTVAWFGWLAVTVKPLQRSITVGNWTVNAPAPLASGLRDIVRPIIKRTWTRRWGVKPRPRMVAGFPRIILRLGPDRLAWSVLAEAMPTIAATAISPEVTIAATKRRRLDEVIGNCMVFTSCLQRT
jgi:hypothetical protein